MINHAVLQVLQSGKTHDPYLSNCARNVYKCAGLHNIDLVCTHVPGKQHAVADMLSKWQLNSLSIIHLQKYICNPIWLTAHVGTLVINNEI